MPNKCCVPNCRGNYKDGPKLSVFSFPNDAELRKKWLRAICRDDFVPTKYTKVCEQHFRESDIERTVSMYDTKTGKLISAPLSYPRLIAGAVPSQIPGCPKYLSQTSSSTRESPDTRRSRLENESLRNAIQDSIMTFKMYNDQKSFNNIHEFKSKLNCLSLPADWILIQKETYINFVLIKGAPVPKLQCAVHVSEELILSAYVADVEIHSLPSMSLPKKVGSMNDVEQTVNELNIAFSDNHKEYSVEQCIDIILNFLEHLKKMLPESKSQISFLKEQILLLPVSKTRARYSWHLIIFCSLLHSISPHAYRYLRSSNSLRIPCPSTVRQVCSRFSSNPQLEQDSSRLLNYISSKVSMLSPEDKTVLLLIDEIHLKSNLDYKGGTIVGNAFNSEECATSAYVFMINSILSAYKEVVHILPVKTITGEILHTFLNDIIVGLESIGFEVLAVVSDNNAINKKGMSFFSDPPSVKTKYTHPKDEKRILYYVLDTVHILKCIRNNWLNVPNQELFYPDFDDTNSTVLQTASFGSLKEMHSLEKHNLLQYGFNLSLKSLYPSSIERQNVKLALCIFNRNTATALRELGCLKHFSNWESTSNFLEIICKWWDIVNVKTPLKGQRLRNPFQEPITQHSCHITDFLNSFLNWLNRWQQFPSTGMLTKETHSALKHTTEVLLHMSEYWISKRGHSYFLCGKIQTDNLEERFGKYRQLSGAQYHVSVRQIFESESKLRIQNAMPLILKSHNFGEISINADFTDISNFLSEPVGLYDTVVPDTLKNNCRVDEDDIDDIPEPTWPLLTYIGGYNSYAIMKNIKCDYCKQFLVVEGHGEEYRLISINNRGGLCFPHSDVVCCVSYMYLVMQKLISKGTEVEFLKQTSQKNVAILLGMNISDSLCLFEGHNCVKHGIKDIIQKIMSVTANILLNNYTKRDINTVKSKSMPECKRRKLTK